MIKNKQKLLYWTIFLKKEIQKHIKLSQNDNLSDKNIRLFSNITYWPDDEKNVH